MFIFDNAIKNCNIRIHDNKHSGLLEYLEVGIPRLVIVSVVWKFSSQFLNSFVLDLEVFSRLVSTDLGNLPGIPYNIFGEISHVDRATCPQVIMCK